MAASRRIAKAHGRQRMPTVAAIHARNLPTFGRNRPFWQLITRLAGWTDQFHSRSVPKLCVGADLPSITSDHILPLLRRQAAVY